MKLICPLYCLRWLCVIAIFTCPVVFAQTQEAESILLNWGKLSFKSNEHVNLHHFLTELATNKTQCQKVFDSKNLSKSEAKQLKKTVALYQQKSQEVRHILFDGGALPQMTSTVLARKTTTNNTPLSASFARALPIYRRLFWTERSQKNAAWVKRLQPKLAQYGEAIQKDLERLLQEPLITTKAYSVDVVHEPGTPNGAYTSGRSPQTVITSARKDYDGWHALEMLFHEVVHNHAMNRASTLAKALKSAFEKHGVTSGMKILHPLHFYTVGEISKKHIQASEPNYQTYADKNNLYTGRWDYEDIFRQSWQPYLDNKVTLPIAANNLARALKEKTAGAFLPTLQ